MKIYKWRCTIIRLQKTMKVKRGKHAMTWAGELFDYMSTTHEKSHIWSLLWEK
jgi:hypothetical protein